MFNKLTSQKSTILKVLSYIKNYRALLITSIALAAVWVVITLYIPVLIGNAIDFIVGQGEVDFAKVAEQIIIAGVLTGVAALLQWIMNTINNKLTYNVARDVRNEAFRKLEILPLSYIDSHRHGDTVNRIISDVDQFTEGLLMGFSQFFIGIGTIIGTLVFMLTINVSITVVVVVLTPISLFVAKFIASKTFSMFKLQSKTRSEQTSLIDEMIGEQKVVQAFSYEDDALEQFDEVNDRLEKCSLRAIFFSSLTNPCTRFVNSMVYAAVGLTGAIASINGFITVGALSCLLNYANQYTKPFNEISGVITELQNALACASHIFELIEEESEISDSVDALDLCEAKGDISVQNVCFSYEEDKPLIRNFELEVASGQRVAIVGPTGCGKTTLINLFMRFYDVDSGEISVDGNGIKNITRHSLRRNYGMVLQDTWLKTGTVRENIAMGKPDATDEEIKAAAKASHAHSFIKRLPNGYDTVIKENGAGLSQGQRQLLCIARVMLCLPPMLILDEATSSIDTRTEIKIQQAFNTLMKGKTSFIVAHRLSTIKEADVILVMRDGNIVEKGTHNELLSQNGFYAHLYNSQFDVVAGEN